MQVPTVFRLAAFLLLAFCCLGAAWASDDDPLAVLDEPKPTRAAGDTTPDDPLSVLDEASPANGAPGDAASGLDALDPEDAAALRRAAVLRPTPDVTTAEVARELFEAGDLARAEIMTKVLLREDKLDTEALMIRADLALARYDGAGAEATLRRALDAQVPRGQVEIKLARALNLKREYRRVLDELTPARLDDPAEQARLLAEQARAHVGLGNIAEARITLDEAAAIGPDAAAPYIGRAVLALRDGFPDQARVFATQATEREPDNGDAWLLLGQIERRRGNAAAAEVAFGQSILRAPSKWMPAYWRALTRIEQGQLNGAERDIRLAAEQFPGFVGLAYARARLDLARGQSQAAANGLERYLASVPTDADALFYAALAANQQRNHQQALGYLDRLAGAEGESTRQLWLRAQTYMAADDHAAAARLLRPVVVPQTPLDSVPLELILTQQEALFRLGRRDEAMALVERARAARPKDESLRVADAKLRFAAGEPEAAEAMAQDILETNPNSVDALLIVAEAALRRGEAEPRLAVQLRQLALRAPADIRVPTLRAEILAAYGQAADACAALAEALRIDPGAGGVLSRMQKLRCASVDPELVQQTYRSLLAERPDLTRALPGLLAFSADAEDADAGLGRLTAALAQAPEDLELRTALVDALLRLRRLDAAQAAVDAAPSSQASHPLLLRARGVVALARGADGVARAALRDLASARPDSAEAAYLLAEAEARMGDTDAATYSLLDAWRLDADHPLAPVVVARIFASEADPRVRRRLIGQLGDLAPDSPLIEPLQAQTLLDAGYPDKALEIYEAMHTRDPDNRRLFARMVRTMAAAGQREPIIALAEPWMARHPDDATIALVLADVYAELGQGEQAIRWYRRVLELAPDNLFALNDLAVLLTESDPVTAVQLAKRAYAMAPHRPQVMDTYGAALLSAGETARARALLSEAYGYNRGDAGIGLNLARALAADGQTDAARRVLAPLAATPSPRQADARALLQRLSAQ